MEQITITRNDQVSIDDLVALKESGVSVIRSAHVGNLSPYNLALAAAGIEVLSVDHNITGVDSTYVPEAVLRDGQSTTIARSGVVVCKATLDSASDTYLDDYHIGAVNELLPSATLTTNSAYLKMAEAVTSEIVDLTLLSHPHLYNRIVNSDGSTARDNQAARLVAVYGIMQLQDDVKAETPSVMLPLMVDIVANFIIEALRSDQSEQYHLSGPAMVHYIQEKPKLQLLNDLYRSVKKHASFSDKLPDMLAVHLIPSTAARFVTTMKRGHLLDRLIEAYHDHQVGMSMLAGQRKTFFVTEKPDKPAIVNYNASENEQKNELSQAVAEKLADIPEILATPPEDRSFVSQYDALSEGGLYSAPINSSLSMAQLQKMYKDLKAIFERHNS